MSKDPNNGEEAMQPAPGKPAPPAEELTHEERERMVRGYGKSTERKALRLIDTLTADRDDWLQVSRDWRVRAESAEADVRSLREQCQRDFTLASEWKWRFEVADIERRAAVERAEAAERERDEAADARDMARQGWAAAEAECAPLRAELVCIRTEAELTETRLSEARAEVERQAALLDMCSANFDRMIEEQTRADAAETRLDAATELLQDPGAYHGANNAEWWERVCAFLAAQPASPTVKCPAFCPCPAHQPAAPARTEAEQGECAGCGVTRAQRYDAGRCPGGCFAAQRTEAEQRVLDACAAWDIKQSPKRVDGSYTMRWGDVRPIFQAELARRSP
jgi:hypothetical protein